MLYAQKLRFFCYLNLKLSILFFIFTTFTEKYIYSETLYRFINYKYFYYDQGYR